MVAAVGPQKTEDSLPLPAGTDAIEGNATEAPAVLEAPAVPEGPARTTRVELKLIRADVTLVNNAGYMAEDEAPQVCSWSEPWA